MAQESCNLDKDEAEILKPSSPPPPTTTTTTTTNTSPSSPPPPSPLILRPNEEFSVQRSEKPENLAQVSCKQKAEKCSQSTVKLSNRCSCCRKKVGLTAFRCRCGDLFCPRHRYSDTHDCSFDYKALGREEISKANPVIRAAKIIKI